MKAGLASPARRISAALSLTALALFLAACGGGGGGSQTSAEATPSTPQRNSAPSPGGSGQAKPKHLEGAEEEVEGFGAEASGGGKEAILAVRREYLTAIAEKDYPAACGQLGRSPLVSMKQIVPPSMKGMASCPTILSRLLSPTAAVSARQQLGGRITKVRMKGNQAFIVFHAPGARLYVFSMVRESGRWKVATLTATILAPSAATLGSG